MIKATIVDDHGGALDSLYRSFRSGSPNDFETFNLTLPDGRRIQLYGTVLGLALEDGPSGEDGVIGIRFGVLIPDSVTETSHRERRIRQFGQPEVMLHYDNPTGEGTAELPTVFDLESYLELSAEHQLVGAS